MYRYSLSPVTDQSVSDVRTVRRNYPTAADPFGEFLAARSGRYRKWRSYRVYAVCATLTPRPSATSFVLPPHLTTTRVAAMTHTIASLPNAGTSPPRIEAYLTYTICIFIRTQICGVMVCTEKKYKKNREKSAQCKHIECDRCKGVVFVSLFARNRDETIAFSRVRSNDANRCRNDNNNTSTPGLSHSRRVGMESKIRFLKKK